MERHERNVQEWLERSLNAEDRGHDDGRVSKYHGEHIANEHGVEGNVVKGACDRQVEARKPAAREQQPNRAAQHSHC